MKLTPPILYLVFNRIDTVKITFPKIRKAKPEKLFIAADGPRNNDEKKKTDAVRKYILKNINWKCKIKTLFRDKNLGCKYAVSSAIDWFFENVEQGIILEDDCLPSQSFFRYCQKMLEEYKDDERIMHISGTNVEINTKIKESYFFSTAFNVWGWATWRRAWKSYDVEMKDWKKWKWYKFLNFMKDYSLLNKARAWRLYNLTCNGRIDTWDYQWDFVCKSKGGLSVIPQKNQITNIGFEQGTHTTNYNKNEKTLEKKELEFPLKKNNKIIKKYMSSYEWFFRPNFLGKLFFRN